jgi:hypothetical protein
MKHINTHLSKWTYFNRDVQFNMSMYEGKGKTVHGLRLLQLTNYRLQEILFREGPYAILKRGSYSYRSGQGYAAHMMYVEVEYSLVRLKEGEFESTGRMDFLFRGSFGKSWKKGIEELQFVMKELVEFDKGNSTDENRLEFLKTLIETHTS